jgi:preprotein translocase subunit Sss1
MQLSSVLHVSRHPDEEMSTLGTLASAVILLLGFGGFLVGVISLLIFALKNL